MQLPSLVVYNLELINKLQEIISDIELKLSVSDSENENQLQFQLEELQKQKNHYLKDIESILQHFPRLSLPPPYPPKLPVILNPILNAPKLPSPPPPRGPPSPPSPPVF
ncbi:hypothetical protein BC833DRAFT_646690, partial [Globomyces pollinis-pini]